MKATFGWCWRNVGPAYAVDEFVNHGLLGRLGLFSERFCDWVDRRLASEA